MNARASLPSKRIGGCVFAARWIMLKDSRYVRAAHLFIFLDVSQFTRNSPRGLPRYLLFVFLATLCFCGPAAAQSRVALVFGNSAYRHVPTLPNTANDAGDIASALERL